METRVRARKRVGSKRDVPDRWDGAVRGKSRQGRHCGSLNLDIDEEILLGDEGGYNEIVRVKAGLR